MKVFTAREKNLTTLVIIIGLFSGWWYLNRILSHTSVNLESQIFEMNERLKISQRALDQMKQEIATIEKKDDKSDFKVPQSKVTMSLMEDLTEPAESNMVKIMSVQHSSAGAFSMVVEGKFIELMRFISFLERAESRFWVGNVQLGKAGEVSPLKQNGERIRGSIQIAMKG